MLSVKVNGGSRVPGKPSKLAIYLTVLTVGMFFVLLLLNFGGAKLAVAADTTTHTTGYQGWSGGGNPAYLSTAGPGTNGGLSDATDYMASWAPNGNGLVVSMQGSVYYPATSACGGGLTPVSAWGYRALLFVPGNLPTSGWNVVVPAIQPMSNYASLSAVPGDGLSGAPANPGLTVATVTLGSGSFVTTGTYVNMPALPYTIVSPDGATVIPEGSILHIELWLQMGCVFPTPGGWFELASVEVNVHTGIGSSSFTNRGPFTTGDVVSCAWQVGYVPAKPGTFWTIFLTSTAQGNNTVAGPQQITTFSGAISYTVVQADVPGKIWCDLRNNLVPKDFDDVAVTTATCKASPPSFAFTGIKPQTPKQGQTVVINFTAAPNPATKSPIARIDIAWGYGSPTTQVSLVGSPGSYSFLASQAGFLTMTGIAYDGNGCPSASSKTVLSINQQPPNSGVGGSGVVAGFSFFLPAIILLGVGAVLLFGGLLTKNPLVGAPLMATGFVTSIIGIVFAIVTLASWVGSLLPRLPGT